MPKSTRRQVRRKPSENEVPKRQQAPGKTLEAREKQMIGLATDFAEKQMRAGTASSQIVTHYLKLGSSLAELDRERLENENLLLKAKAESLKDVKKTEILFKKAINAMREYSGESPLDEDTEFDEEVEDE